MSLKIVHNAMTTEDKEIKMWAKIWVEKQRAKWNKKKESKKPRA